MDFQDIQIFARVAAVQNLSAVGIELSLTPGTISKRVQSLEDELGVRLFERTTRSIRITEEGSRFLAHVETILTELEKAKATVADTTGQPKGKLKIVAAQALTHSYVGPAMVGFMRKFPDVDVHVDFSDRPIHLQDDGYDIAIMVGTPVDSPLIAKRLEVDRQVLVASPCYLERYGAPARPADLPQHACLSLGDVWAWTFAKGGEEQSVKFSPRLRSDSAEMLRLAAAAGAGIARLSALQVSDDIAAGRLVMVLAEYDTSNNAGVWVLYPSGKHILPRLRVFIDHLIEFFRDARQSRRPLHNGAGAPHVALAHPEYMLVPLNQQGEQG